MDRSITGDDEMVPAEHALELVSVDKAWKLLATLSTQVVHKQSELQLMVGSRYHELIDSADSIVSMKEISTEVLDLLQGFPQACSSVLNQALFASTSACSGDRDANTESVAPVVRLSEAIQVMLHAPAGMWAALDSNRILVASNLLLRCRKSWADVSSSCFADVDPGVAAFLRSHLTYVEQFPQRIVLAGFRVLTSSRSTEETAGALTALLQLEAHKEADPLRCLLELLLRRRGGAILAMLNRATKERIEEEAEEVLRKSLAAVQRTILDVYTMLAPRPSGECWVVELAQSSHTTLESLKLAPHKVKELCTQWLTVLTPKIRSSSKHLLSAVGNTNTLARIRGALWGLTHGPGAWGAFTPEQYTIGLDKVSMQNVWTNAVAFAIDVSVVGDGAGIRGAVVSPSLNLWALFFGNIFAELAEALLKDSLLCIRRDVEHRLDSILLAITGSQARGPLEEDASDHLNHNGQRTGALMAHQVLAASEAVVFLLTSELRHLSEDAWSLTERGDEAAADALKSSFYLLCVDMAAGLANHFRIALQEIRSCIKDAAKKEHGLAPDGGLREREDVVRSLTDAALVVGRVAWMLNGRSGRPLQSALTCPGSFAKRLRGRIEQQQLEAAFVIADTDGDGIVDADEAAEALQAVSFGSCAELVLDPMYSSLTLTEFILLATRLLEEQRPLEHLTSCFDDLLVEALAAWAEWALERPAELLASGCIDFAALCRDPCMTDSLWRQTHGIWEDTTIELDRDDGHGVEETIHSPVMISPAFLCYIEGVAAELGRILSTSDLVAARSVDKHTTDGTHRPQAEGNEQRAKHKHSPRNDGLQETAHRARSLAAARASSDLKKALSALCDGPHSAAAQACEAAHLQLLLDALFLQKWVLDDDSSPSTQSIVDTLSDLMDPINLQIYLPHLQRAASVCWSACYTSLSLIFEEVTTQGIFVSAASMTPGGAVGSSSSFVALAPKVRRFEILPLPLDAVRLLPANVKQRVRSSPAQASSGGGEEDGAGSSAQSRGMQAGRQALAGLMDQVGSVGSVLSAQNVNVQSVLGAASLFLGGRTRRGDGEEFREF